MLDKQEASAERNVPQAYMPVERGSTCQPVVSLVIGNGYRSPHSWESSCSAGPATLGGSRRHVRGNMVSTRGGAIARWYTTRLRLHLRQLDNKDTKS